MTKKKQHSKLLVLSGGLDSFVLAHKMTREEQYFRGLYINVGKSVSRKEVSAVKRLSLKIHLPIDIINFEKFTDMQVGYIPDAHIDRDEADIKDLEAIVGESYISGFQVLLGIASYHAQIIGSSSMALGVIKDQFDKYPKLSNVFSGFESIVSLLNPNFGQFSIETPLSTISKAEVIKIGADLGADFEYSWSCLFGRDSQCGKCSQCLSRKAAFESANVKDPTVYEH